MPSCKEGAPTLHYLALRCTWREARLTHSWAETEVTEPLLLPASSSPTDTDGPGRPDSMTLEEPDVQEAQKDKKRNSDLSPSADDDGTEAKTSVYLDAVDDHVADLMRQLRDIPEPSGNALETLIEGESARLAEMASVSFGEAEVQRENEGTEKGKPEKFEKYGKGEGKTEHEAEGKAKTVEEDKAAKLELARKQANRCSTSSLSLARRRTHSAGRERRRHERHDAVVELHEESPAAFQVSQPALAESRSPSFPRHLLPSHTSSLHLTTLAIYPIHPFNMSPPADTQDFLFWAYPHLDCKVTWTNVARVSQPAVLRQS